MRACHGRWSSERLIVPTTNICGVCLQSRCGDKNRENAHTIVMSYELQSSRPDVTEKLSFDSLKLVTKVTD